MTLRVPPAKLTQRQHGWMTVMLSVGVQSAEVFELLDLGVGVYDESLRLNYCNPAFKSLRRYPDALCKGGVTLEALLRHNAERGDFGPGDARVQVAERMAEINVSGTRDLEREMADGQILYISYRRTRSGGLLVTFDDRTSERRALSNQAFATPSISACQ